MHQRFAAARTLLASRHRLHRGISHIGLQYDRTGTVENGDVNVRYYDRGPEDAELTVLYVHGFNISSESFYMQVAELDALPVRQVLLDYRGHGRTTFVHPEQCTIDDAADDVYAVVERLGLRGPLIIVGHSLGGPVSLSLMRRYNLNVAGSVQISSTVEPFAVQGLPQILAGPMGDVLEGVLDHTPGFAEGIRKAVTSMIAPFLALGFYFRPMDFDLVRFHADMIQKTPLATYAGFFDDLLEHSELDAAAVLADIPGYILVGERDTVAPVSQSERLHDIWPRAHVQALPESGHMPPLDAPGAVSTAIIRLVDRLLR